MLKRIQTLALSTALLIALLPFIVLSRFNYPNSDDFCFAATGRELGWLAAQQFYYDTWTGRFTATALLTSFPLEGWWYQIVPIGTILLTWVALGYFLRVLLGPTDRVVLWGFALVILVLYLRGMPTAAEGIYWLAGTVTYQWAGILSLLSVTTLLTAMRTRSLPRRIGFAAISALAAVLAVGSNETILLALIAVLGGGAGATYAWRLGGRAVATAVFLAASVAAAIVVMAPGNTIRSDLFTESREPLWALVLSVGSMVGYVGSWAAHGPLLLAIALFFPYGLALGKQVKARWEWLPHPLLLLSASAVLLAVGFFPSAWGTGNLPVPRVGNILFFVFLILCSANLVVALARYGTTPSVAIIADVSRKLSPGLLVLFCLSLFSGNVPSAYWDLLRTAPQFAEDARVRHAAATAAGRTGLELSPLGAYPSTITLADVELTSDPDHWVNQCYASYFGLEWVRLSPDDE